MKRDGMTLIDLTVVLGVLLFLAAIIYPTLSHQHGQAMRSQCQVNIKQIGLAIIQYSDDNAGRLPAVISENGFYGWGDAVQPYTKMADGFQCPTESMSAAAPNTVGFTDYFYNRNVQGQFIKSLTLTSNIIMLGDGPPADARSSSNGCLSTPCGASERGQLATLPGAALRHFDGANFVFVDGHVKWLKGNSDTQPSHIKSGNTKPTQDIITFAIK